MLWLLVIGLMVLSPAKVQAQDFPKKPQGFDVFTMGAIIGIGPPKGTSGPIIDYLEANFRKVTEDRGFHATAKEIYHPWK